MTADDVKPTVRQRKIAANQGPQNIWNQNRTNWTQNRSTPSAGPGYTAALWGLMAVRGRRSLVFGPEDPHRVLWRLSCPQPASTGSCPTCTGSKSPRFLILRDFRDETLCACVPREEGGASVTQQEVVRLIQSSPDSW